MLKTNSHSTADSEVIALKALGFLASDGDRIGRFLNLTGLTPAEIRAQAAEPAFLKAVLEYLMADESLLLVFAEQEGLDPASIGVAARRLAP